jgi:hypothetical protein
LLAEITAAYNKEEKKLNQRLRQCRKVAYNFSIQREENVEAKNLCISQ